VFAGTTRRTAQVSFAGLMAAPTRAEGCTQRAAGPAFDRPRCSRNRISYVPSIMRRSRSVIALLTNVLLIHVMWIGTGSACVMPDMMDSHHAPMTGMSMPGMDMGGMNMSDMGAATDAPAPSDHDQTPCRFPWAPDGCQSMTPCAPLAIGATQQVLREVSEPPVHVAALRVLMPPSSGHAPEPPPPRA
jgi:hypothetical protein